MQLPLFQMEMLLVFRSMKGVKPVHPFQAGNLLLWQLYSAVCLS